ncbi:hypothetical protein [Roseomonas sp. CECT 9278]|uniref:hypothetical protein n=1 Tax=Roseomonas sp. CECT 9278 TaxID=2845823 RepID=UPI001E3DB4CE|nr:hypothetical protein [Roseomonas sp. CECT 9278]
MLRAWFSVCLVIAMATPSANAQTVVDRESWRPSFEHDPQGGVLCAWSIYIVIQRVGAVCFPEERTFQTTIDESVRRLDEFIIVNMPTSRQALEVARTSGLRASGVDEGLAQRCTPGDRRLRDIFALHRQLRSRAPDLMRAEIDQLLATPRRPSMNPCL